MKGSDNVAVIINEESMINQNVLAYEDRLHSPMARFIDKTPSYVTYYHIDTEGSTVDEGYQNIASYIGNRSPLRFNKIERFPLYGIEDIVLQLEEEDQGLDTAYEGDAVIVPNTIKPLPDDYFIIPYIKKPMLFRVTNISFDTIAENNFYKINFKLEHIDSTKIQDIEKQVDEKYTCILQNIGTENNCIIQTGFKEKLDAVDKLYDDIADTFVTLFYNDRHNSILGEIGPNMKLFDPLQAQFINKYSLFNKKNNFKTIILTDQFTDSKRKIKYENSIYRLIETRDMKRLSRFPYRIYPAVTQEESSFSRWDDISVYIMDVPITYGGQSNYDIDKCIISEEFCKEIEINGPTKSSYGILIKKWIRGEELHVEDIDLSLGEEILHANASIEIFFFTPIILYIIKKIVESDMRVEKEKGLTFQNGELV